MTSLYDQIGPSELAHIVSAFYDEVFSSPVIGHLFRNDKEEIKAKQLAFLTHFLGGPPYYSATYGHPRMRMRHLPHAIDNTAKDEWLRCMKKAIDASSLSDSVKLALYNCFPAIAQHMVNS